MNAATLEGRLAFDSGVILEMLEDTPRGRGLIEAVRTERVSLHCSRVNMTEVSYLLCRRIGRSEARKSVESFLGSGFVSIEEDPLVHFYAAEIKCERAIALPDCYTLAVARAIGAPALFASRQSEIVESTKEKPFAQPVWFLDEP